MSPQRVSLSQLFDRPRVGPRDLLAWPLLAMNSFQRRVCPACKRLKPSQPTRPCSLLISVRRPQNACQASQLQLKRPLLVGLVSTSEALEPGMRAARGEMLERTWVLMACSSTQLLIYHADRNVAHSSPQMRLFRISNAPPMKDIDSVLATKFPFQNRPWVVTNKEDPGRHYRRTAGP